LNPLGKYPEAIKAQLMHLTLRWTLVEKNYATSYCGISINGNDHGTISASFLDVKDGLIPPVFCKVNFIQAAKTNLMILGGFIATAFTTDLVN
jgi:hypothetical protein